MGQKIRGRIILIATILLCIGGMAIAGSMLTGKAQLSGKKAEKDLPGAKEEYMKILHGLVGDKGNISIAGTIRLFDGEKPSIVKETSNFFSYRSGRVQYMEMSGQQSFSNGRLNVQIDTVQKIVMVSDVSDSSDKAFQNQDLNTMLDKVFNDTATFKVMGAVTGDDNERTLQLKSDLNPEVQSCSMTYSPLDYRLKGVEIRFWKNGGAPSDSRKADQVWISKVDYHTPPGNIPNVDKLMDQVLSVKGHIIQPGKDFLNYRFILK